MIERNKLPEKAITLVEKKLVSISLLQIISSTENELK